MSKTYTVVPMYPIIAFTIFGGLLIHTIKLGVDPNQLPVLTCSITEDGGKYPGIMVYDEVKSTSFVLCEVKQ